MKTWKLNPSRKDPSKLVLIGPYDVDFVGAFKAAVPSWAREWRPTSKTWIVEDECEEAARLVIAEHTIADAPSDLVGLDIFDESGKLVGAVTGVGPHPHSTGALAATCEVGAPSFDDVRELSESLGTDGSTLEVWEALELIGTPTSVTVREVDGKLVVVAEVEA